MKIALIGEYSSYSKYLKDGLVKLGHSVTLYANGDGWKQIPGADFPISKQTFKNKFLARIQSYVTKFCIIKEIKGFDIVHLVNTNILGEKDSSILVKLLKKQNRKISVACVGIDYALFRAFSEKKLLNYIDLDRNSFYGKKNILSFLAIINDMKVVDYADYLIPALWEYKMGYEGNPKITAIIPLPVTTELIEFHENKVSQKIVFFHGLNREESKGTMYIKTAFDIIKEEYGSKIEIIMKGNLPFNEYLELMNKTNVVVDQCLSYGYGINALVAMSKGKIVMSGARQETLDGFGISDCPIINITNDVNHMVSQIKYIIENAELIPEMGRKSRQFVERFHDSKSIAEQYCKIWNNLDR